MSNVYLALKRSVGIILLFFCQAAFTQPVTDAFSPTAGGGEPAASKTVLSDTVITVEVDTGATGNVSVTTPFGTAYKSGFTFIGDTSVPDTTGAAPIITSFTPTSGSMGTTVTILGKHFTGATSVQFGGEPAASKTVLSDTVITAEVDTGATGNVTVTTPFGTAYKSGFTFIGDTSVPDTTGAAPIIISFTPTSGSMGTTVTIFGKHFTGATSVQFGGEPAASKTVLSDTVITAEVDTGATGNVTVYTPYGIASKAGFIFIADTTVDTVYVNTRIATGSGNAIMARPFKLYPNPASQYVIWQQPATDHATRLQLIDISGRVVRNIIIGSKVSQATIPVSGLHTGVYKLVWNNGKKKLTRTLLIQ